MKDIRKIKRIQLKSEDRYDFSLFGIVSAEPDYKISLTLNNTLGIALKNSHPVKSTRTDGHEIFFSRFSDLSAFPDVFLSLISNRTENELLIRNLKNIDYILLAQNPYNLEYISSLAEKIRSIDIIPAVFNIDITSLKDKNLDHLIQ